VEDFERGMELLAETDGHHRGRWIITPRKGVAFIGPRARAQERARERRRKVFIFLLESVGLMFLIGLVPPLRVMWYAAAAFAGLLGCYVWLLLSIKERSPRAQAHDRVRQASPSRPTRPMPQRYAAESGSRTPRPMWGGLGALVADEAVHIVVRPASDVGMVRV
jgi:hypothetical protein